MPLISKLAERLLHWGWRIDRQFPEELLAHYFTVFIFAKDKANTCHGRLGLSQCNAP